MFTRAGSGDDGFGRRFTFPSSSLSRGPSLLAQLPEDTSIFEPYSPSWILSNSSLTPPSFPSSSPLSLSPSALSSPDDARYTEVQAFLDAELKRPILHPFPITMSDSSPASSSLSSLLLSMSSRSPTSSTAAYRKADTRGRSRRGTAEAVSTVVHASVVRSVRKRFGASCHLCKTTRPVLELFVCTAKAEPGRRKRGCRKKFCQ